MKQVQMRKHDVVSYHQTQHGFKPSNKKQFQTIKDDAVLNHQT
jgi:hypothetical protein